MHGISTIVEFLLITLLLITLVSLLWLFTSGTINAITKSGTNQTQRAQEIFSTCMIVDSVYGNMIYLKNCGYGVITNDSLNVYLDDTLLKFNMTPQTIGKGGVGTININSADFVGISIGYHNLKITNPNSQTVQSVEASLPDSCVLALDFDEGSGNTAHDSSGKGNDGTLTNITNGYVTWDSGYFGKAVYFYGANTNGPKIEMPVTSSLNISQPFTIIARINPKSAVSDLPIVSRTGGSGNTKLAINEGGHLWLTWGSYSDDISLSGGDISINKWQFVAATYDKSGLATIYINDVNVGSTSKNVTNYADALGSPFRIGNYWPGEPSFNGTIDSARIFNQALTPDQTIILKMK